MKSKMVTKVASGEALGFDEAYLLFSAMMKGELTEAEIAAVLVGMRLRGETSDEIAGAGIAMNEQKVKFTHTGRAMDTCGTGGDGKSTLNVSTAVSLVLSALGVPVVKHGNVAQSGKVGSADMIKMLGIPVDMGKEDAEKYFVKNGFVFLFAPMYHPAMRFAGPVRRQLRVPTIFNFLGPLSNPAKPDTQVIGISRAEKLPCLAEAVQKMNRTGVILYTSRDGYDEVSSNAPTDCHTVTEDGIETFTIDPADYFDPFPMPTVENPEHAQEMFMQAISGQVPEYAKLVALNAALGLSAFGTADSVNDGFEMAMEVITGGGVTNTLEQLRSIT